MIIASRAKHDCEVLWEFRGATDIRGRSAGSATTLPSKFYGFKNAVRSEKLPTDLLFLGLIKDEITDTDTDL